METYKKLPVGLKIGYSFGQPKLYRIFEYLSCFLLISLVACCKPTPTETPTYLQTPLPMKLITRIPDNKFLFVFVHDIDYTCLDGRCKCPVSEVPRRTYEFVNGKLQLAKVFFPEPYPTDWAAFRNSTKSIALYGDYSQWSAQFKMFQSFPITSLNGVFTVIGANEQGDIQIKINDGTNEGYGLVFVNAAMTIQIPKEVDADCKVLHEYTLSDYGFINDKDVSLDY